ncbi:conserved hypothetical protein [uncultured Paludibacter sp.]|uniref:DUF4914 domain-containing protein n=1 Tax=uncultured Paludibacter sp. TaxID=497635 RepID=A0A653ACH0_9BACT|nr:conserved hypothetical protein [uncultured Paludibacter sp.]
MSDFISRLEKANITLPEELRTLLNSCKSYTVYDNVDELEIAATNGADKNVFEVKYDIPGKGEYTEAIVHRVKNGISANYTEAYMRRRDPDTMVISDNLPTDKEKFTERFGYEFSTLKEETFEWLKKQDLAVFLYFAGREKIGVGGIAICPANAGFFAMGLAMLQVIVSTKEIPEYFSLDSIIYVAPTFRHTHFNGKQIVVHNRTPERHEIFSYNLYPGPSAKKGLYGALLTKGEREGWITAHCSTVQAVSPYDNTTTFMHEGASGGGKSEMLQYILREPNGQVLIGRNTVNQETRLINLPLFCSFKPVTDDMALCHPTLQNTNGKLRVLDAENSWFIRVDSVNEYGDDPALEKITVNPPRSLLFLNLQSTPNSTVLIWEHTMDEPGKPCPNPRVILPRDIVENVIDHSVSVDIRSFGVRTPPSSRENPNYGIIGLFHMLPPALAWLWRLVAPRGHANPSISSTAGTGMDSEGVGSYWPFATGKMVHHANMLLEQIMKTPETRYTLVPNQYIGVWKVGFKPQLLMREYLTRRGNISLRRDQYKAARCPLLGYELNYLTIEGAKIPSRFLQVYKQDEVGTDGYDAGAEKLYDFFKKELQQYLTPDLNPLGRQIIEACLNGATVEDYEQLLVLD